MNRVELNDKYYKYFYEIEDKNDKKELIKFFEYYQHVLLDLLNDIKKIEKEAIIKKNKLSLSQEISIHNCSKNFIKKYDISIDQRFSWSYNEIMDFIYKGEQKVKPFAQNELDILKVMVSYLIMKADEIIYSLDE